MRTSKLRILAIAAPFALVSIDRFLKTLAVGQFQDQSTTLIPGVVFSYFKNTGLAFSLFTPFIAIPLSLAAIAFLIVLFLRTQPASKSPNVTPGRIFAYSLIALGGASNVFDRVAFGGVTDYLIFLQRSAVNIADGMILAGLLLALVLSRGVSDQRR